MILYPLYGGGVYLCNMRLSSKTAAYVDKGKALGEGLIDRASMRCRRKSMRGRSAGTNA